MIYKGIKMIICMGLCVYDIYYNEKDNGFCLY